MEEQSPARWCHTCKFLCFDELLSIPRLTCTNGVITFDERVRAKRELDCKYWEPREEDISVLD